MVSTECRRDEHDADEGMPQMSLAQFAEDVHDELEPPETQKSPKKGRAQHLDNHKTAQFVLKKIGPERHCDDQVESKVDIRNLQRVRKTRLAESHTRRCSQRRSQRAEESYRRVLGRALHGDESDEHAWDKEEDLAEPIS